MSLSVIGAGLGRTGTASLKVALEMLGLGKCHHMSEVFGSAEQIDLWTKAAAGKPDWPAIFSGYGAAADFPAAAFWRQLASFYPDAKVILTLRDPEQWYQSTQETILNPNFTAGFARMPFAPVIKNIAHRFVDGELHDHDHLISLFNRHNEEVKKAFSKDRLLVFEAKEGWASLCKFLGKPVPSEPFPHVNSKEEMKPMMAALAAQFVNEMTDREKEAAATTVRNVIHGRKP